MKVAEEAAGAASLAAEALASRLAAAAPLAPVHELLAATVLIDPEAWLLEYAAGTNDPAAVETALRQVLPLQVGCEAPFGEIEYLQSHHGSERLQGGPVARPLRTGVSDVVRCGGGSDGAGRAI